MTFSVIDPIKYENLVSEHKEYAYRYMNYRQQGKIAFMHVAERKLRELEKEMAKLRIYEKWNKKKQKSLLKNN